MLTHLFVVIYPWCVHKIHLIFQCGSKPFSVNVRDFRFISHGREITRRITTVTLFALQTNVFIIKIIHWNKMVRHTSLQYQAVGWYWLISGCLVWLPWCSHTQRGKTVHTAASNEIRHNTCSFFMFYIIHCQWTVPFQKYTLLTHKRCILVALKYRFVPKVCKLVSKWYI